MILTALNDYYHRLAEEKKVPLPGFSSEKVSFCLVFSQDGKPLQIIDLRDTSGKKPRPSSFQVPVDKGRTSGIHAYPLWDKTAYTLGVITETGEDGVVRPGQGRRTVDEHAAFKALQVELLGETDDPGLLALLRFLEGWQPDDFAATGHPAAVLDQNIVFRLEGDRDDEGRPPFSA